MAKTVQQNEGNGFKTVAFGFDKNDVTLYIGALRKKMKVAEDTYEQKIQELEARLRNAGSAQPGSSQDDFVRLSLEKEFNDKIEARDATIVKLKIENEKFSEESLAKDREINSLKSQLAQVESANATPVNTYLDEAVDLVNLAMEHIRRLGNVSDDLKAKVEKTQKTIESKEGGNASVSVKLDSFKDNEISAQNDIEPSGEAVDESLIESLADFESPSQAADEDLVSAPVSAIDSSDFSDLLDMGASADESRVANEDFEVKADEDFDLRDLLVEEAKVEKGEDLVAHEPSKEEIKGNDLGDDLYELLVTPAAGGGDLSEILAEKEKEEIAENKKLEIKPAEIEKSMAVENDFSELVAAVENNEKLVKAVPKREEDVFDFAFAEAGDESDDDMSTDTMPTEMF